MIMALNSLKINKGVVSSIKKSSFMLNRLCFSNPCTNFFYINSNYLTKLNIIEYT